MMYGLWFMVYGLWLMVYGLWFMVYGLWFMVHPVWCFDALPREGVGFRGNPTQRTSKGFRITLKR
jgi:hypothetical protein